MSFACLELLASCCCVGAGPGVVCVKGHQVVCAPASLSLMENIPMTLLMAGQERSVLEMCIYKYRDAECAGYSSHHSWSGLAGRRALLHLLCLETLWHSKGTVGGYLEMVLGPHLGRGGFSVEWN